MTTWFRGWITGVSNPDQFMPEVYQESRRSRHDDWIPGFRWVPRRWTFYPFPMPAIRFAGPMMPDYIPQQEGYPSIPGAETHQGYIANGGMFYYSNVAGGPHYYGYNPVPPAGTWTILGPYIPRLGKAIPLYAALSYLLPKWVPFFGGKRLHINAGVKPDVTLGDNGWNFPEASCTITEARR